MEELKAVNFLGLALAVVIAMVGMFLHYVKRWLRGETHDSLVAYVFGKDTWKYTVQAAGAVIAAVGTMYFSGQLEVSTIQGLVAVFAIGYAGDSALNKDSNMVKG